MILKYGSYAHGDGTVALKITREPVRNDRDERYAIRERWTIDGLLEGASASALTTAINAMLTAYSTDGSDLVLYESNGSTETSHKLDSSALLGGVRIISGPEFPDGAGAEYATKRSFQIVAEGLKVDAGAKELISYDETVSQTGTGGVRNVTHTVLNGKPIRQVTASNTPCTVVQQGRAVGLTAYPAVNPPVLSSGEDFDRRQLTWKDPQKHADGEYRFYEVTWAYYFTTVNPPVTAAITPEER